MAMPPDGNDSTVPRSAWPPPSVCEAAAPHRIGKHRIPRQRDGPNVGGVTRKLFVVERYESSIGAEVPALTALPANTGARLVAAVHLPADDVVLALVEAPDEQVVAAAAAEAGWRVDRLCPAAWVFTQITEA
jgi:hypothetical protein